MTAIKLPDRKFCTRAVLHDRGRDPIGSPDGLLAYCVGFKSRGAMRAHRYNVDADADNGYTGAPPAGGGRLPAEYVIPATALYVVWSYATPIAWLDADGTVTIPPVKYSLTTSGHQKKCVWIGAQVPGVRVAHSAGAERVLVRELGERPYDATCPNAECEHHGTAFVREDLCTDDEAVAECPGCDTPLAWAAEASQEPAD